MRKYFCDICGSRMVGENTTIKKYRDEGKRDAIALSAIFGDADDICNACFLKIYLPDIRELIINYVLERRGKSNGTETGMPDEQS